MKKLILTIGILTATFYLGYAFSEITRSNESETEPKRVTGIGGVFFKCKNPREMNAWYQTHLGLNANPYGVMFEWYESPDSTSFAQTQWTPFPETTKYFGATEQRFMINYRVENMESLVANLKKEGVTLVDSIETYDYGKFIHILDLEGNRVELWEAID